MGKHGELPPHPDDINTRTQTSDDERCDRAFVERAQWSAISPTGGRLTLCNYHFRMYQVHLAMAGWIVEKITRGE